MRLFLGGLAILWVALGAPAYGGERDQKIATQVAQTLKTSGKLTDYEIAVKFRDGTARLEGWVSSQQQLEQALAVVNAAPEVDRVINLLKIRSEAPEVAQPTPSSSSPVLRTASHQKQGETQQATHRHAAPQPSVNVANQVAQNFKQSGALNRYQISVRYENGIAELHGWVSSNDRRPLLKKLLSRPPVCSGCSTT